MRYNKIRKMDISNGEGIRVSVFFQGCEFHCFNCFNPDTWDFAGGSEFTDKEIDEILEKINEIENICKSNNRKTKKWEKVKKIIIWLMDKGVDVTIQLIPSIINNFK